MKDYKNSMEELKEALEGQELPTEKELLKMAFDMQENEEETPEKKLTKKKLKKLEKEKKKAQRQPQKLGFKQVAANLKSKVANLWKRKGITTLLVVGEYKEWKLDHEGGMVGQPAIVVQALYEMALKQPEIYSIITTVSDALKATELRKVTKLEELEENGELSGATVRALAEVMTDIQRLTKLKRAEVENIKGIGAKAIQEIEEMLQRRNWYFAGEQPEI